MDKAFWQSIVEHDCAVPEGYTVEALTPELLELLGSPDPELRDEVAYMVFARWIVRDDHYRPHELQALIDVLKHNLNVGIGDQDTDSVLKRSFSALTLSLIAYYDVQKRQFATREINDLVETGVEYLLAEQDLRGWIPGLGWVHATAHTADLLKFLARHPNSYGGDHLTILNGIVDKLTQPVNHVFIHDEDERLTMAVLEILKRGMVSQGILIGWLERFHDWKVKMPQDGNFDPTIHAPYMNQKNFLRSLYFTLQILANKESQFAPLEQTCLKIVRVFGAGTIYTG
ncbi:MAG TPA: DUF2785 domain-containing protein [Phototrophicaceae bacterium]|jgi:hypothetical protein|nr:DUF2785 domain-containing protein [Phototrophicaceae bacterium]